MKLSLGPASAIAFGLLTSLGVASALAACSDDAPSAAEQATDAAPPTAEASATRSPSEDAASPRDARADAPDAAPRTCSDAGFCHLALPPGKHTLRAVAGDGAGGVWAVSDEGEVLRWNGAAFVVHASGFGALSSLYVASPTEVWVAGENGLRRGIGKDAASVTFAKMTLPSGPSQDIKAIAGLTATEVFVVAGTFDNQAFPPEARGTVYRYRQAPDGGPTWSVDPISNDGVAFTHAWAKAAGAGVFVAGTVPTEGSLVETALYHRAAGRTSFARVALPRDPAIDGQFNGLALLAGGAAAGDDSVLVLGRLGGADMAAAQPGFWRGVRRDGGAPADGGAFRFTYARDGYAATPPLFAAWASGPSDAWAVGASGRVRRFDGATWSPVAITVTPYPVTKPLYGVWSSGPSDVWIVGEDIALRKATP